MADGLNDEQRRAIADNEHRCLASCPGSGKTRTIVAKILRCASLVRGTSRKIGCITYTNAAVEEIEDRLLRLGSSADDGCYEIGTIHSFCLNNVLRPFYFRLPELAGGFEVLAPDDEWFRTTVSELMKRHRIERWAEDSFGLIQRNPNGAITVPQGLSEAAAKEFVAAVEGNSFVTFNDIVYYTYRLVSETPFIARGLASRFAWLLIDEFQDTSACQAEIIKLVHGCGRTKLLLVGDSNQSILGFAGASPTLMAEVAEHIGASTDVRLTGNYRCSEHIVALAEKLCPTNPPMQSIGLSRDCAVVPSHVHAATIIDAVWENFIPTLEAMGIPLGEAAVLAPQWPALFHLARELRSREVPVFGPGARPYKRSRDFAQFAEHACAYITQPDTSLAIAVQKALFILIMNANGHADMRVYSYQGKRVLFRLLKVGTLAGREDEAAVAWLRRASNEMASILVEEGFLSAERATVLTDSAIAMIADIETNLKDPVAVANLGIADLGVYARPKECLQLMTMHRAKGREFDAVAIVDVHEGKIPHFKASSDSEIAEASRLLYVATTRPRKLLMLCTDSSHPKNRPSRFLGKEYLGLTG